MNIRSLASCGALCALLLLPTIARGFSDIGASLEGLSSSAAAWGDYDADGDLDVALAGVTSGGVRITRIYRNDSGTYNDIGAGLTGVSDGTVDWGDLDNDGDLDLLLTGYTSSGPISIVYRNDAGSFTDIGASLEGIYYSDAGWGDYDNDGDLDILLSGQDFSDAEISNLYRNDGGSFTYVSTDLYSVTDSMVAWGDYDNDGDLDIFLAGFNSFDGRNSYIFRNDAGVFRDVGAPLQGVRNGAASWGDYDNDGDLDLLLTGQINGGGVVAQIYRNSAGSFTNIGAGLPGGLGSDATWVDDDNDGDLDVLLCGFWSNAPQTRVYRNNSGSFADSGLVLPGISGGAVACGDYDYDRRLDILLTGSGISRIYRNTVAATNTPPSVPGDLVADILAGTATFTWSAAVDAETPPDGLSYNLRVGTTPGGGEILGPMSLANGRRQIPAIGNRGKRLSWQLDVTGYAGQTLYWSVQAIDPGHLSWAFANEHADQVQDFVEDPTAILGSNDGMVTWGDYDNDGDLDALVMGVTDSGYDSSIYRNDAGAFTNIGAGLAGSLDGSAAWGDYDNDGDLDLVLTGFVLDATGIAIVYRNDGAGVFSDIGANLEGVWGSATAWGDYDNDGDLDLVITGFSPSASYISRIYRNDAGSFTDIQAGLQGMANGGAAWGDYDGDGDLDLLLSGYATSAPASRVYRNDRGVFVDISAGLPGLNSSAVAWGDHDNDGDLDILLAGSGGSSPICKVYDNDGGSFTALPTGIPGITWGSVAWGDYDNDGDLDILLAGELQSGQPFSEVYRNTDGFYSSSASGLQPVTHGSVAWGDYDNDGDLDILLAGRTVSTRTTRLYRNDAVDVNDPPEPPVALTSTVAAGLTYLSATSALDDHTPPEGQRLNLRLGTSPGAQDIVAPMSASDGYQRVPVQGRAGNSWTLDLSPYKGQTVYWSFQSVDAGLAGSSFAPEQSLLVQGFADAGAALPNVGEGAAEWGDYDNDGDLDVLIAGSGICGVYRNDAGAFTRISAPLPSLYSAAAAWGDYDNDDDLDILLTGSSSGSMVSVVFRNDAGSFQDIGAGLQGVSGGDAAWGDYDNDGDLDILIAGYTGSAEATLIYRNEPGGFTDIGAGLPALFGGTADWGDYDNDGDLDVLVAGLVVPGGGITWLLRNDSGVFSNAGTSLQGYTQPDAAWGDYDNDGDLDLLIAGNLYDDSPSTELYRNDGGASFTPITTPFAALARGSVAWGDYDNDGDLDALIAGDGAGTAICTIYRNDQGTFVDIGAALAPRGDARVAWGDYDDDGDLDILQQGGPWNSPTNRIYDNVGVPANTLPIAPGNLATSEQDGKTIFSWSAASDAETPVTGLGYNLRVSTSPGGNEIVAAMADAQGHRRIPALGNAQKSLQWSIDLSPYSGQNIYWSVQSTDTGFRGSQFAPEKVIGGSPTAAPELPARFALAQNRPNPFNPSTLISFELPAAGEARLQVFDLSGALVRTLHVGPMPAGRQSASWDGRDAEGRAVASGIYLYRLEAGDFRQTRKMTLLK